MGYFVYIMQNPQGIRYKGVTQCPAARLHRHNSGTSRYTKGKGPWHFVFIREFPSKTAALVEERRIKRLNPDALQRLVLSHENQVESHSTTTG